ncbi:MAG: AraC family transcriptional regulator [Acidobacteriota bacterium]
MDPFVGLLDGPRARGAFALRCVMTPPWSLRIRAESPLTLIAAIRGEIWILPDDAAPIQLETGDLAVTRGPDHYTVAGSAETPPSVIIHPGQHCCDLEGRSLLEEMTHGTRTWGNDPHGETLMLVGAYENMGDVSDRLLRALPPVLSLSHREWESPLVAMLCDEAGKDQPGQGAVLDRLLDLLLIAVLRAWFDRPQAERPAWYRSQADPVVGKVLKIMHQDPAESWTLARLSSAAGVSRAALARRFHEVVGEPPMAFLTAWRLALAADLLCESEETVGTVAQKVGYSSPFALSSAFKRVRGISPQEHRARARAAS